MYIRRRKSLLWIWLITALLVSLTIASMSHCAKMAVVTAPTIIDETLTPGSTFSINITVANTEDLWGIEFILDYNTTVLTATNYSSYDPFTQEHPSQINDTAGTVALAFSMPMGTDVGEGFSTDEAVPILRVDFTVDSTGNSTLYFERPLRLSTPKPAWITYTAFDGFFTNEALEAPDIAITDVTASPTSVLVNDTVTVTVTVENQGIADTTFNVSVYYTGAFEDIRIETRTDVTLSPEDSTTLTFTWNTTGVAEGTYTIKAKVPPVPGEIIQANNLFVDGIITVKKEKGEAPNLVMYAGIGIAIVIVAIVLVYVLRRRKP